MKRRTLSGMGFGFALLWLLALASDAAAQQSPHCRRALDSDAIQLPQDDAVHPPTANSFEWFYWTSHLEAADGRQFGFLQIVYSALGEVSPGTFAPVLYADTTVSDLSEGKYHFGGRQYNFEPGATIANGFDLSVGNTAARGGAGRDHLHAVVDDGQRRYVVDLHLYSLKAPVEELATDGLYEYARTRLFTVGTITIDDERVPVAGFSVFDHAFGDMLPQLAQVDNWTWLSLQLDDGSDLLLLQALRLDGSTLEYAILVDDQCNVQRLRKQDVRVTPVAHWQQSPSCVYPVRWQISVASRKLQLTVASAILNQDIFLEGQDHYYEGEVRVTGSGRRGPITGRGVVELTWFCDW